MKINNIIRFVIHFPAHCIRFTSQRNTTSQLPPEQLALALDQFTQTGLRLREAIPVRTAEYWLQVGHPDLALEELQTLPEPSRQHARPVRVQLDASHATKSLSA